jgi:hypothetical protein
MDATLQELGIPGSRIIRQGTGTIDKMVKSCVGTNIKAEAAFSGVKTTHSKAQLLRRDAAKAFLQDSERCTASAGVLQQFTGQNADVRCDLARIMWLTVAALLEKAMDLRRVSQKRSAAGKGKGKATAARKKPSSSKPRSSKHSSSKHSSKKTIAAADRATQAGSSAAGKKRQAVEAGFESSAEDVVDLTLDSSDSEPVSPAAAGRAAAQLAAEPPAAPKKKKAKKARMQELDRYQE